ncbi:MAG: Stp1/IreP family PP2C-type Ser/Thr phosphatase [bacterium]
MKAFAITDIGRIRQMNQDSVFASAEPVGKLPNLFIVADGMGGHNAGDFASRYTVETIVRSVAESEERNPIRLIRAAIEEANAGVRREAEEHRALAGMGTTVVVTTVVGNFAYTANVGDSRMYLYDGRFRQVTHDHSLVEEMVRLREITREEARYHPDRNIITRAIGMGEKVNMDFFDYKVTPGSTILMCTDGLHGMVEDAEMEAIVERPFSAEEKARRLVEMANAHGGMDNIGVVIVEPDADEEVEC